MPISVSKRSQVLVSPRTRTYPSATISTDPDTAPKLPIRSVGSDVSSNSLRRATNDLTAWLPPVPPRVRSAIDIAIGPRRWIEASVDPASNTARSLTTIENMPVTSVPPQETVTAFPAAMVSANASAKLWLLSRAVWVSPSRSSESARSSWEIRDLMGSNSLVTVRNSTRSSSSEHLKT